MFKLIIIAVLCITSIYCSNVPIYHKQADSRWASEHLGISNSKMIGQDGSLLCSLAMAMNSRELTLYDSEVDPYLLNTYLLDLDWEGSVEDFPWSRLKDLGMELENVILNDGQNSEKFFDSISSPLSIGKTILLERKIDSLSEIVFLVNAYKGRFIVKNPVSDKEEDLLMEVSEISRAFVLEMSRLPIQSNVRMLQTVTIEPFPQIPYNFVLDNEGTKYYGLRLDAEPWGSNGGRIASALILMLVLSSATIIVGIKKLEWQLSEPSSQSKASEASNKKPEEANKQPDNKPVSSPTNSKAGTEKPSASEIEKGDKRSKYTVEEERKSASSPTDKKQEVVINADKKKPEPVVEKKKQEVVVNANVKANADNTPIKNAEVNIKVLEESNTKSEKTPATKNIRADITSPKELYTPSNLAVTPNNKVESLPAYNLSTTPKNQQLSPSNISEKNSQYEKGSQGVSPTYNQGRLPSMSSPQNRSDSKYTSNKSPTHTQEKEYDYEHEHEEGEEEEEEAYEDHEQEAHDAEQIEVRLDQEDENADHENHEDQGHAEPLDFEPQEEQDDFEVHEAHEGEEEDHEDHPHQQEHEEEEEDQN